LRIRVRALTCDSKRESPLQGVEFENLNVAGWVGPSPVSRTDLRPLCLLQPSLSGSHAPREAIAADQVASRPGADGCQRQLPGKLGKGRKERRMRTSAPQFVACEELVWIKADGSETEVVARVGAPYPDGDGAFFCPVELSGVDGRYPDIGGSGSLQSLCLAVRLLSTRLGHLLEDGERIVRPR